MTTGRFIHIVDDEAVVRASTVSLVQAHGRFECREYESGESFISKLDSAEPGCVILDLQLNAISGATVMRALAQRSDAFRMIVVTGFSDLPTAIAAFQAGAVEFLHKPYEMRALLDAIERAFHLLERGTEPPELVEQALGRIARLGAEEAEILARLVRGETHQDIAKALHFDARQVQILRARALTAIEAPSILAAIRTTAIAGWPPAKGPPGRHADS